MNSLQKTMDEQQLVVEKIDECVSKSKIKAYDILLTSKLNLDE